MTITLTVAQRLRLSRPSPLSVGASGFTGTPLTDIYFVVGFKRTTGAPTVIGDFTDKFMFRFYEWDAGSYKFDTTGHMTSRIESFNVAAFTPSALAGDHMWLALATATGTPPDDDTFEALRPIGTLQA